MNPKMTQDSAAIDAEQLSKEHSRLSREQYEALQYSSYLRMSRLEADAYDKRRLRIEEICCLLGKLRSK
jgi:hypothetical protein